MDPRLYFFLALVGLVCGFLVGWAIVDSYTAGNYGQAFGRDLIIPIIGALVMAVVLPNAIVMLKIA